MKEKYFILLFLTLLVLGISCAEGSIEMWNGEFTKINQSITIYCRFYNTDNATVNASFAGDIYFGAERVHSFKTETKEVLSGDNATFFIEFVPMNLGRYNIKGFVFYNNQLTETKDSYFNTLASMTIVPFATEYSVVAMLVIAGVVLAIKYVADKRQKISFGDRQTGVSKNEKYKL
jgi:uncharacterized protein (DUF2164 family)